MTVSHDALWDFEGRRVPIHWHEDLEINLPRKGNGICHVYQEHYQAEPGQGLLLNRNVPHSFQSADNQNVCYSTILVKPEFLYGEFGSDVERNCFRPFLQNQAVPCIVISGKEPWGKTVLQKLDQVEEAFDHMSFGRELKIKGLLCEALGLILEANAARFARFIPANQRELERLEQMLTYLNTHFDSVVSLQELADQVHLSREVCCRLFRKMTGKTITGYLEEYRAEKSLSLVQSGQYSMIQIADMTGFSNPSRFAAAFRKQFGCNPGEYNSTADDYKGISGK